MNPRSTDRQDGTEPEFYEIVIPISQLRWRMAQLGEAGVLYSYQVDNTEVVITVAAADVDAAQAAMDGDGNKQRKRFALGDMKMAALAALLGVAILPLGGLPGLIGFALLGLFFAPFERKVSRLERDAKALGRGPAMSAASGLLNLFLVLIMLLILAQAAAVSWLGVDLAEFLP